MTTFARLVNGFALDCRVHASATEMAACFHPDWLAANPFVVVPDGTMHGAKDNGNGTFSNPIVAPPPVVDLLLARSDLIDHLITQLGGAARFGAVIAAAKTATDGTVAAYYEKYSANGAPTTKAQAQTVFTAIRAAGLPAGSQVTVAEITAIVTNWPKG